MVAVDSSPVFIARAAEIELLDAALARAAAGRPSVVVVGGEAGIGKTRLLEEFQARVRDRAVVVIGRCFPDSGDDSPYGPFADLFRDLVSQTPPDRLASILGPARTELGLVVPELGTAVDRVNPEDGVEVRTASRERLFERCASAGTTPGWVACRGPASTSRRPPAIAALLVGSKVLSVQYVIWLLPFVILLPRRMVWLLLALTALSTAIYTTDYTGLLRLETPVIVALLVRNVLLAVIAAWPVVDLAPRRGVARVVGSPAS